MRGNGLRFDSLQVASSVCLYFLSIYLSVRPSVCMYVCMHVCFLPLQARTRCQLAPPRGPGKRTAARLLRLLAASPPIASVPSPSLPPLSRYPARGRIPTHPGTRPPPARPPARPPRYAGGRACERIARKHAFTRPHAHISARTHAPTTHTPAHSPAHRHTGLRACMLATDIHACVLACFISCMLVGARKHSAHGHTRAGRRPSTPP